MNQLLREDSSVAIKPCTYLVGAGGRTCTYGWLAQELLSFQYNSNRLERGAENDSECMGRLLRKLESAWCYRQGPPKRTLWMQLNSRSLLERAAVTNASCFESSLYILTEIKSQAACGGRDTLPQRIIAHEGGRPVGVGGHCTGQCASGELGSPVGFANGCEPHQTPLLRA